MLTRKEFIKDLKPSSQFALEFFHEPIHHIIFFELNVAFFYNFFSLMLDQVLRVPTEIIFFNFIQIYSEIWPFELN